MEKTINVFTHIRPDYDAIGSAIAAAAIARVSGLLGGTDFGNEVTVWLDLSSLTPLSKEVVKQAIADGIPVRDVEDWDESGDACIVVDCSGYERICAPAGVDLRGRVDWWFDHHNPVPMDVANGRVDIEASSAAEVIMDFAPMFTTNPTIATACALGLIGDTVGLTKANAAALRHAATLCAAIGDAKWQGMLAAYTETTVARKRFLATVYSKAVFAAGVCTVALTAEDVGPDMSVMAALGNDLLNTQGIHTVLIAREGGDGFTYCQVRTRLDAPKPAQAIAEGMGGGGHPCAAGAKVKGSLGEVFDRLKRTASSEKL